MQSGLEQMLHSYRTTVTEDEALLRGVELSSNGRTAVRLRRSEKLLIQQVRWLSFTAWRRLVTAFDCRIEGASRPWQAGAAAAVGRATTPPNGGNVALKENVSWAVVEQRLLLYRRHFNNTINYFTYMSRSRDKSTNRT